MMRISSSVRTLSSRSSSGAIVSGHLDLIVIDSDGQVTEYDIKTGSERDSDAAQVMIYMYVRPLVLGPRLSCHSPKGRLIYRDANEKEIPSTVIDDDFKKGLFSPLRRIDADMPPIRVPSERKCEWGDLTSTDCHERIEDQTM